jgi:hypothetical protein
VLLGRGLALAAALAVAAGCTSGGPTSSSSGSPDGGQGGTGNCKSFFGDAAKPMEIEPALLVPGKKIIALHDGDDADLIRPQQGGHCLFVAARVKNLCEDDVKLEGKILDADGYLLSGPDGKSPVVWVESGGFLEPEPDNGADMPNVCACPAQLEPIADHQVIVEATATDRVTGRVGTARVRVTPVCTQTNAECKKLCQCECGPNGAGFCPRPSDIACETNP